MAKRVSLEPLALDGRSSPKRRRQGPNDITPEQVETFFATLEETCNVVRSCKAAGFSKDWAYRKRRLDAAFRNGWAMAVREGYARLELVLLERAMAGTPKLVKTAKGEDRVMREYSTALAVALLKRHADLADTASEIGDPIEMEELRDKILGKLERLRRRVTEEEEREAGIETKSAAGRVERIARLIRR